MDLVPYGREGGKEWDEYLAQAPEGTIFHTWDWLNLAGQHTIKKTISSYVTGNFHPLIAVKGDEPIALVPLFSYSTPFFKIISSPPFSTETVYLGPVLIQSGEMRSHTWQKTWYEVKKAMDRYMMNDLRASFISIHTPPGPFDPRPFHWSGYEVIPEFTYELHLDKDIGTIFSQFSKNLRNKIRKAESYGISIRPGDIGDLISIYDRLEARNRIHATKDCIVGLFQRFSPSNMTVLVAEHEGTTLGGVVLIHYKDRAYFWIGSPRSQYNGVSPNILALWDAIRRTKEGGRAVFELLGASDKALFPFKCKFNGELSPVYVLKWYSPLLKGLRHLRRINE